MYQLLEEGALHLEEPADRPPQTWLLSGSGIDNLRLRIDPVNTLGYEVLIDLDYVLDSQPPATPSEAWPKQYNYHWKIGIRDDGYMKLALWHSNVPWRRSGSATALCRPEVLATVEEVPVLTNGTAGLVERGKEGSPVRSMTPAPSSRSWANAT